MNTVRRGAELHRDIFLLQQGFQGTDQGALERFSSLYLEEYSITDREDGWGTGEVPSRGRTGPRAALIVKTVTEDKP